LRLLGCSTSRVAGVDLRSRKGFKLVVWSLLAVFAAVALATGSKDSGRVALCVVVLAYSILTTALLLSGRSPWWARSAQERRAVKEADGWPNESTIQRLRRRRASRSDDPEAPLPPVDAAEPASVSGVSVEPKPTTSRLAPPGELE